MPSGGVLIDGVFDPLHPGHLKYFAAAQRIADELCHGEVLLRVGAQSKREPLLSIEERAEVVAAVVRPSDVLLHMSLSDAIIQWRPIALVKGDEWRNRLPKYVMDACRSAECDVHYTNTKVMSSTDLMRQWRIRQDEKGLIELERHLYTPSNHGKFTPEYFRQQGFTLEQRRIIEGKHPRLIQRVFSPHSVLDYGCGPGCLVTMLRELGVYADGHDPELNVQAKSDHYELVICREVLEHCTLREITTIIDDLSRLSDKWIYVTTRFQKSSLSAFSVEHEYETDPTHITCLDQWFLRSQFVMRGWVRDREKEREMDWQNKGRCLVYRKA